MKARSRVRRESVDANGLRKTRAGAGEWCILARLPGDTHFQVCSQHDTKIAAIAFGGYMVHSYRFDAFAVVNLHNSVLECVYPLVPFPGKIRYGTVDMSQFPNASKVEKK